jgi:hypothetical protein
MKKVRMHRDNRAWGRLLPPFERTVRNRYFGRVAVALSCHNRTIDRLRLIWVLAAMAFGALCAGGLIALASSGEEGGGKPHLSGLEARLTGSSSSVVVTGYVRGARNVLTRYGRDCRVIRLDSSQWREGQRFRLRVPLHGSTRRARRCRAAISRRPLGHVGSRPRGAKRRPVRVIACAEELCINRWIALRRPSRATSGPHTAATGRPCPATRVMVAPGVSVPVPTCPPVSPDVPASRFVGPAGSDTATCAAGDPCHSFNRAYRVAQPGQVVEVAGGGYPSQTIEYDPSKTSPEDVYFRPAVGAAVKVDGDIDVYGSHVTVMAMQAEDTDIPYDGPADVSDVTFWAMDGRNFTIDSGQDVNVIGGDYGPASSCGGAYGGGNNGIRMNREGVMPSDILIWGVDVHDVQSYDLNACHIECLIVGAGENITVRSSRFWNCSIFDIFLQPFNGSISDVTLENNWFAAPTDPNGNVNSGRAVEFSGGGPWHDLLIRHNSVNTAINLNDGAANPQYVNTSVIGNIAVRSNPPCFSAQGVLYRDNVWQQGTCAPSDRSLGGAALPFVRASDHADLDYHLTGGVAVDLVPASASNLADDIDGDPRPHGAALDAGSDER